ncbi:MAG: tetratricopeptide repeat protein [Armatimonadota bacterium]
MSSVQDTLELGHEKLRCGEYASALACADTALTENPASIEALQLRSRALHLLGRDADTLQTLRDLHNLRQQNMLDQMIELSQADEALLPEHADYTMDVLETLLELRAQHRLDADLLQLLAELAEESHLFPLARETFEELVALESNRLEAWEGLVFVLSHQDLDATQEVVQRALDLYPTHALFFEFLGFISYHRGRYRQAVRAYQQAIEYGADHLENYQSLVLSHFALGDTAEAMELMRLMAQRQPDLIDTHQFAIEMAMQCEDLDTALAHAHQLVRLQPSHAETYSYKAWVELVRGDWSAAERTLRLGFHKAMDGAYSLYNLVDILINGEALDDALQVADLALTLAPNHPESCAARGKVLREMGRFDEALTAFKEAATLAPQDDAYLTWIGVVLDNKGDYPAAVRQYDNVLSRHPSDVWTLCNRGLSYLALDLVDHALADFNRGIEIDAEDAALYFWRACALVRSGDPESALQDLRRAVDLHEEIQGWLLQETSLEPLHGEPRFQALLRLPELEGEDDA